MATQQSRRLQYTVFGASGFTGQFVVEELARVLAGEEFQQSPRPRWAVAGRNRKKLEEVLAWAAERLSRPELSTDVGIIICDVGDPSSLEAMCKQSSVVLDCVGPYRFFGEPVVRACVENGAHFVDISGEPQFLETMCMKYDRQAAENGVYIVGSTGFDSIPADMGVIFTRDSLKGTLTAVESILTFKSGPLGTCIHDGTWQSAIHGIADQGNLKKLRKQLAFKPLPVVGRKLKRRGALSYAGEVGQYTIPFLGADASVVKRSQRYFHDSLQETPVQYSAYAAVGGLFSTVKLIFAGLLFAIFTKFNCGRQLLIKYPKLFSFGYFSSEGPSQQQMDESSFEMTFFGEGYSPGKDPQQGAPDLKICTRVSGPEAGYITTPIAMVQAAVVILTEPGSLPKSGGVFSPGAAFSKTKIIERLDERGLRFNVVSRSEA